MIVIKYIQEIIVQYIAKAEFLCIFKNISARTRQYIAVCKHSNVLKWV